VVGSHKAAKHTIQIVLPAVVPAAALDEQRAAKQAVFQAMLQVPWVAGEGIPDSPTDGTEYAALLEAGGCRDSESVAESFKYSGSAGRAEGIPDSPTDGTEYAALLEACRCVVDGLSLCCCGQFSAASCACLLQLRVCISRLCARGATLTAPSMQPCWKQVGVVGIARQGSTSIQGMGIPNDVLV
jgi:hypothetical protein